MRFVVWLLGLLAAIAIGTSCAHPEQPALVVTPAVVTLISGQKTALVVTRQYPGGPVEVVTGSVTYTSTNKNIANASEGVITAGEELGTVSIRAVDGASGVVANVSVTVNPPKIESIEIVPNAVSLTVGTTRQLTAMATLANGVTIDATKTVNWSSSNEAIATVGRTATDFGLVTAINNGQTTISATSSLATIRGQAIVFVSGSLPKLAALVVTPNPATIPLSGTLQFAALGIYSDGSRQDLTSQVVWSSKLANATIEPTGLARGVSAGETTITAAERVEVPDGGAAPAGVILGSAAASVR